MSASSPIPAKTARRRIEIQAPDVDGLTYLEDAQDVQPGDMIPVRIAQGFAYDLVAERMD